MDLDVFGIKQLKDESGKVIGEEYYMDPLAEYVKPFTLTPGNADLSPANPELITIGALATSPDVTLAMVDEGLFEGAYLTAQWETNLDPDPPGPVIAPHALIELFDNQRAIRFTGRPCHVETIIGNGLRPFILAESIAVDKRQPIVVRFTDLSNEKRNVRFMIHGQRMYSEQIRDVRLDRYIARRRKRNMRMAPYMCPLDKDVLLTNKGAVGGGDVGDYYYSNDSQIAFEVRKITYWQSSSVGFKFKVFDEKHNSMQTDWIHAAGGIGTAQYPFLYYGPWLIKPGGKVTFTIQNLDTVNPNTIKITLSGRQHFVYPGP